MRSSDTGVVGSAGLYGLLVRAYPRSFRADFGAEMLETISLLRARPEYRGLLGRLRLWLRVVPDVLRGAVVERVGEYREREDRPPYAAASLAALCVLLLYVLTLAPTAAFWDSGEYITAAHTLGIPHPPGNPLFVLVGYLWDQLLAPLGLSVAVRLNLLSAVASALAHGFWFLLVDRVLAGWGADRVVRRVGASAAVILSATAFTVWNQSNVNEKVYTLSLLSVAAACWLVLRWRDLGIDARRGRRGFAMLALTAFLVALSVANHLMGLLVVPALLAFALAVDARALWRPGLWLAAGALGALALSVHLFLPLRAAQRPILAEGDPRCESLSDATVSVFTWGRGGCDALSSALTRRQYDKPSMRLDPTVYPYQEIPRSPRLVAAQLLQYVQYFDWQWARSVGGASALFGGARPLFTLLFLGLGVLGAATHWRRDRASAVLVGVLFATYSIGLVAYLNFKYGFSIGWAEFPNPDFHEVRERDYFFLIGFSVWALWAACGLVETWMRAQEWLRDRPSNALVQARLATAPILAVALLPLALNWGWATREHDYAARDFAYNALMSVEPYGVLFTHGDNDTFPLWYLQQVEGVRPDVTVAVLSYMNTPWYVRQLRDLTRPCEDGVDPQADPTRIVCQRSFRPDQIPDALLAAGFPAGAGPPADSAFPLTDAEIDQIAGAFTRTERPIPFSVGAIDAIIAQGTILEPADTFVAMMLQRTVGDRPVHFIAPGPLIEKLGLSAYAVRVGLTYRIDEDLARMDAQTLGRERGTEILSVPRDLAAALPGSYVDVARTDTLLRDVFRFRGRIVNDREPWVDPATTSIPIQYASAHLTMAAALDADGRSADRVAQHLERFDWWQRRAIGPE